MRTIGRLETVEKEMGDHGIGCLGLSETRWNGKGHFVTDLGSTVMTRGKESIRCSSDALQI